MRSRNVYQFDVPSAPPCPNCGKVLDAATAVRGKEAPESGCLSVCMYCAALLQFNERGELVRLERLPDDADETTRRTIDRVRKLICQVQGIRS